jgi:hypothetical protein
MMKTSHIVVAILTLFTSPIFKDYVQFHGGRAVELHAGDEDVHAKLFGR